MQGIRWRDNLAWSIAFHPNCRRCMRASTPNFPATTAIKAGSCHCRQPTSSSPTELFPTPESKRTGEKGRNRKKCLKNCHNCQNWGLFNYGNFGTVGSYGNQILLSATRLRDNPVHPQIFHHLAVLVAVMNHRECRHVEPRRCGVPELKWVQHVFRCQRLRCSM